MHESADPASEVHAALHDLYKVVHVDDMHANGGLSADPSEFDHAWTRFDQALRTVVDVIHAPKPGQGLASIWLRKIHQEAGKLEDAVAESNCGRWEAAVFHNYDSLMWLVTNGWRSGHYLRRHTVPRRPSLSSMLAPNASPLVELRELANSGDDIDVRRAGELLLKATNALELRSKLLTDEEFCERVINNLDTPSGVIWSYLTKVTREGLLALIERFAQERGEADNRPSKPYPAPKLYQRDKWIYENIGSHTRHSLSLALKSRCRKTGWKLITSRNGFKKASKRYANHHGLPTRGFSDDPADG